LRSKTQLLGVLALSLSVVGAPRAEEPPPVYLDEQVIRVPRAEAAGDPTAAATVIDASRFAGEAKDVAALVATAPGVAVNNYGGLGQLSTVSIRGSMGSGVVVLIDGLPLDTGGGAGTDLSSIPRHWVSRIEVLRGAEGAYVGAGALGGVVEVVTRHPQAGAWSAEAGSGSFDTFTAGGDYAAAAGPWTVFTAGSFEGTGGRFSYLFDPQPGVPGNALVPLLRENSAALRGGALVKASRAFAAWRLDTLAQLSAGHRDLPGWPYALTPYAWQDDGRLLLSARLAGPSPRPDLDLALRLHARADWLNGRYDPARALVQRGAAGGAQGEGTLRHPGGQLKALLAVSAERLESDALGGARSRATVAAGAAEDLLWLAGRLRLAPALRVEQVGPFGGWSAKVGATWAVREPLSVRASAGRSFRAPGFAELYLQQGVVSPNPDLRPETGLGGDMALVLDGAAGLASVGAFAQVYDDLIIYKRASFERLKPFNDARAQVSGLEVEAASTKLPAFLGANASAAYTFLVTENLRGPPGEVGKEVPFRARHRLYARFGIEPGPVELHAEVHYVSRQFQDAANTAAQAIPAALVFNAGGSVRLLQRPSIRLHLEVKNLADDRTLLDQIGNPLPGRMVMITLRSDSSTPGQPPPGAP
jgi:vitamin B12 transporter